MTEAPPAERLIDRLRSLLLKEQHLLRLKGRVAGDATRSDFIFSPADLDELQILHSYCWQEFPKSFNEILNEWKYATDRNGQENFLARLLRIYETEKSIPEEFKQAGFTAADTEELTPVFRLDADEIKRINTLCEQMRKIILASTIFDAPHRRRLLNRIAAIVAEAHKPKGMFDVILGGINDVGETLKKFGTDIKPLTDRMQEVAGITRKKTKAYDQIPAPEEVKKLPKPDA